MNGSAGASPRRPPGYARCGSKQLDTALQGQTTNTSIHGNRYRRAHLWLHCRDFLPKSPFVVPRNICSRGHESKRRTRSTGTTTTGKADCPSLYESTTPWMYERRNRHTRFVRRLGRDGGEHSFDRGQLPTPRRPMASSLQVPQVVRDRPETHASRCHWHDLRQTGGGGSDGGRRHP